MTTVGAVDGKNRAPSVAGAEYSLRIDWKAYFIRFCEEHGTPVRHAGNYLFQDGFRYATDSHAGPEWRPPEDPEELFTLQRAYWRRRLSIVKRELRITREKYDRIVEAQETRSVPLQQTQVRFVQGDKDIPKMISETFDVDLEGFEGRLAWLEEDIEHCKETLDSLERGRESTHEQH